MFGVFVWDYLAGFFQFKEEKIREQIEEMLLRNAKG